jgi:hypothetical protein
LMDNTSSELADAEESLKILEDTERFLIEDVGGSGELTLATTGQWADQLARTRELIASQRVAIKQIKKRNCWRGHAGDQSE